MRSIDSSVLAQLAAEELRPFLLLSFTVGATTYRYTDCDVPIVEGGDTYEPRGFEFGEINYSSGRVVDSVDLQVDDTDRILLPDFVGGTPQGGAAILRLVVLDADYAIIGTAAILFQGEIDDWSYDEPTLKVSLTGIFARWRQRTTSRQPASCRWKKFKGTECAYSGSATWCDRTYVRCEAIGNTANFGGERWLPSIIDKVIWWGRIPHLIEESRRSGSLPRWRI
jgi:hypothetical protein